MITSLKVLQASMNILQSWIFELCCLETSCKLFRYSAKIPKQLTVLFHSNLWYPITYFSTSLLVRFKYSSVHRILALNPSIIIIQPSFKIIVGLLQMSPVLSVPVCCNQVCCYSLLDVRLSVRGLPRLRLSTLILRSDNNFLVHLPSMKWLSVLSKMFSPPSLLVHLLLSDSSYNIKSSSTPVYLLISNSIFYGQTKHSFLHSSLGCFQFLWGLLQKGLQYWKELATHIDKMLSVSDWLVYLL